MNNNNEAGPPKRLTMTDALPFLKVAKDSYDYYMTNCPCCGDEKHLYIRRTEDDALVARCYKCGKATKDVAKALIRAGAVATGAPMADKEPAVYVYTDDTGEVSFYKERYYKDGKKEFAFYTFDEEGNKKLGLPSGADLLYNKAALAMAQPEETLYIVEGEKDADTLINLGLLATTTHTGARGHDSIKLTDNDLGQLSKFPNKVIIPDNDMPGHDYAKAWPKDCKVLDLRWIWPECSRKADITDFIEAEQDIQKVTGFKFVEWDKHEELEKLTINDFLNPELMRSAPADSNLMIRLKTIAQKQGIKARDFDKLWNNKNVTPIMDFSDSQFPPGRPSVKLSGYKTSYSGVFDADDVEIIGAPLTVVEIRTGVADGNQSVKLSCYLDGKWKDIVAPRADISRASHIVETLSSKGVPITSENARGVVVYLNKLIQENSSRIKRVSVVNHGGWHEGSFIPYYNGENAVEMDPNSDVAMLMSEVKSCGDLNAWIAFTKELRRNLKVRMVMAASFASVILEMMQVTPFILFAWGGSGCGKTVSAMVAASVWACPILGKYIKTLNSTELNLANIAAGLRNLPCIFDEWQVVQDTYAKKKKSTDQLVMTLCEGVERGRANKAGQSRATRNWANSFVITGEAPMLDASAGGGSMNRVLEIQCLDGNIIEDGRATVEFINENYGLAGPEFIAKLPEASELKAMRKAYEAELYQEGATKKQAMVLAALMVGDELASGIFYREGVGEPEEPLTVEAVKEFLRSAAEVDKATRAMFFVKSKIASELNKFKRTLGNRDSAYQCEPPGECWGDIKGNKVRFNKTVLEGLMKEHSFNLDEVKRSWCDKGFLEKRNGSYSQHDKGDSYFFTLILTDEEVAEFGISVDKRTDLQIVSKNTVAV